MCIRDSIEGIAMTIGFGGRGLLESFNVPNCIVVVAAMTAGSAFLMWIGEEITEYGVGNGISIVLLINIVSRIDVYKRQILMRKLLHIPLFSAKSGFFLYHPSFSNFLPSVLP